ncbi:MAG: hypothetical protein NXY57DRAFT_1066452 [Lentinula lateritia]|nr:MAG: hypothetical protein NXY57DRAFT_1066452 [Lentinula lateritia]
MPGWMDLYLIVNFGNVVALEEIFPFYSWRIYKMSEHNWWLIGPIAFLSVSQAGLSLICSGVSWSSNPSERSYNSRIMIFRMRPRTREIVDATLVFTINDGFLSWQVLLLNLESVVAIATVCLAMDNSVYLGIYFTISKFYSNSVLATLNLRNWYRHRYAHLVGLSLMRPLTSDGQTVHHGGHSPLPDHSSSPSKHAYPNKINGTVVEVHMQRQVEYDISNLITNDTQANAEN